MVCTSVGLYIALNFYSVNVLAYPKLVIYVQCISDMQGQLMEAGRIKKTLENHSCPSLMTLQIHPLTVNCS